MAAQNTVKRKIDVASPVWIPFVINMGFLAIVGGVALYNYIELPKDIKMPSTNIGV